MGLPLLSWYSFLRMFLSSSISTALDDVEPPSIPITARSTVPGTSFTGSNFGILYCSRNAASSPSVRASGGAAESPSLALRPPSMNAFRSSIPRNAPTSAGSCSPYITAPNAA
jgi:hypothetical protein